MNERLQFGREDMNQNSGHHTVSGSGFTLRSRKGKQKIGVKQAGTTCHTRNGPHIYDSGTCVSAQESIESFIVRAILQ